MPSTEGPLERILHGSAIILAGNIAGTASIFLVRIIVGRYLGSDQYGTVVISLTMMNLLSLIVLFGIPEGLGQRVPRSEDPEGEYLAGLTVPLVVAIIIAIVGVTQSGEIARILGDARIETVSVPFLFAIPFVVCNKITVGYIQGHSNAQMRVIIQNVGLQLAVFISIGISVYFGIRPNLVPKVWAATLVAATIIPIVYILKVEKISVKVPSRDRMISLFSFSLPLMFSSVLWLLMQEVDNISISYFATSSALGIYDSSFTIGRSILVFVSTLGFLTLPAISKLDDEEESGAIAELYRDSTRVLTFATLPLLIVLMTIPRTLIKYTYGHSYTGATLPLMILSLGFFSHTVLGNNGNALTAIGKTKVVAIGSLLGVILDLILNIVLIPHFGIVGAAIASAGTYVFINCIYSIMLYRGVGIQPLSRKSLAPIGMVIVVIVSSRTFMLQSRSIALQAVAVAVAIIATGVVVGVFGVSSEERRTVEKWIRDRINQ